MAFRICLPSNATITGLGASNRASFGFQIGVFTKHKYFDFVYPSLLLSQGSRLGTGVLTDSNLAVGRACSLIQTLLVLYRLDLVLRCLLLEFHSIEWHFEFVYSPLLLS